MKFGLIIFSLIWFPIFAGCNEESELARITREDADWMIHTAMLEEYMRSDFFSVTHTKEEHLQRLQDYYLKKGGSPDTRLEELWKIEAEKNSLVRFEGRSGTSVEGESRGYSVLSGYSENGENREK